jgi:hypothetical protein
LPRYAGPIAHFLVKHPDASRDDVLDFIGDTWNIRVGRTALYEFLKKYGLDRDSLDEVRPSEAPHPVTDDQALTEILQDPPTSGSPLAEIPEDFFSAIPNTPVPSSCSRKCSAGGTLPNAASRMSTVRSSVAF